MRAFLALRIVATLSQVLAQRTAIEALLGAARSGDAAQLKTLLAATDGDSAAALDARDAATGQTPLMAAAIEGHGEAVEVLLEKGADISVGDTHGLTPIHAASREGWPHVVEAILRKGENPDAALGKDGLTPLHRACQGSLPKHVETVATLLRAGANPILTAEDGRDCAAMAVSEKMRETLKGWMEHEMDVPALVAAAVRGIAGSKKNKKAEKKAAKALKACMPLGANTMFLQGIGDALAKIEARRELDDVVLGLRTLAGMVAAIGSTAQATCKAEEAGDVESLVMAAQKLETVLEDSKHVTLGASRKLTVGGVKATEAIEELIFLHRRKSGADFGRALAGFVKRFEDADLPSSEL